MNIKPILFNTEMVNALFEERKTVTRRVVKPQPLWRKPPGQQEGHPEYWANWDNEKIYKALYNIGDLLYVRETWTVWNGNYEYKADVDNGYGPFCPNCTLDICTGGCNNALKWRPSIHMPKEAARLFLRVTDVRVERLQDITDEQALTEGVPDDNDYPIDTIYCPECRGRGLLGAVHPVSLGYREIECTCCDTPRKRFSHMWNSTTKPKDRALYGWDANPWVFVISFERCEKPKEW